MTIVARQEELKQLAALADSSKPEFLAVYGRRRVGKTFLISQFFQDKGLYFELTGMHQTPKTEQLKNFSTEFADKFYFGKLQKIPTTWQEAFTQLKNAVAVKKEKVIIFFDELPWLASKRSGFLPALEHLWNRYLSRQKNIILIVCGSAASWMIKKIINNKGGLYGRLTAEMFLQPLNLPNVENFLKDKGVDFQHKQIAELYMALGGIPKYLEIVTPHTSVAEIIQKHCFLPNGSLATEFPRLFHSLFDAAEKHVAIVSALSSKRCGMTRKAIAQVFKKSFSGRLSHILTELEMSGFIKYVPHFGKKNKDGVYRLVDEYTIFYFDWIKPAMEKHADQVTDHYWLRAQSSHQYYAWAGLAFESLCFKHLKKIVSALKLEVVVTSATSWRYTPDKSSSETGVQIDLLLDRADRCIHLCQIKFCHGEFVIDKVYEHYLANTKEVFRRITKTKKTIFTTLITPFGVKKNVHYHSVVNQEVILEDLFRSE